MRFCLSVMSVVFSSLLPLDATAECTHWVGWERFAASHVQSSGRVVDYSAAGISTSEGQAYALFFSLVAGDRARFESILRWTQDNLAQGSLQQHLPAWKWGRAPDGKWQVLDSNSASDADLWLAYSLLNAAERWHMPSYRKLAKQLLENIKVHEVVNLPSLGAMVLPGMYGFAQADNSWRLNPSYLPIQLLRYFAKQDAQYPWAEIAANTARMLQESAQNGRVADWVAYSETRGFAEDVQQGRYLGYDAIRVYLWWAMLDKKDALHAGLRKHLSGVAQFRAGNRYLPERIDVNTGEGEGSAPSGFSLAIAPYRRVMFGKTGVMPSALADDAGYYNQVLGLFALGWLEGRFKFAPDGSVRVGLNTCTQ